MAREAGLYLATEVNWMPIIGLDHLKAFEALVRADQREIDAKVCESLPMQQEVDVRDQCAAAIRARGNT
jgi:hypothetical protein